MLLRPNHLKPKLSRASFNVRPTLLRRLIRKFGYEDASQQLRWIERELYDRSWTSTPIQDNVASTTKTSMTGLIYRLLRDEPIAYVLGTQPFGSLVLKVAPPVLIPRPETEEWTMELLKRVKAEIASSSTSHPSRPDHRKYKEWKILDLCTGSGCIPLLLSHEWPFRHHSLDKNTTGQGLAPYHNHLVVHTVDISEDAIRLSRTNAERILGRDAVHVHTAYNPYQRGVIRANGSKATYNIWNLDIFSQDFPSWLAAHGPFDIITCNPPYIPDIEYDRDLPRSVKAFEDHRALKGGADGLRFYRRIVELLSGDERNKHDASTQKLGTMGRTALMPRGFLALEFGQGQGDSILTILNQLHSMKKADLWTDAFGLERAVFCQVQ